MIYLYFYLEFLAFLFLLHFIIVKKKLKIICKKILSNYFTKIKGKKVANFLPDLIDILLNI